MNSTSHTIHTRHSWAFASRKSGETRFRIISSSKEAKQFGVRDGMDYESARHLLPELKVLIINKHHV